MAGEGPVIVLDPAHYALEQASAQQIRAKMLQETIGGVGKSLMDEFAQYNDIKDKQQKSQLAAITTAGTLSGGLDKLPQDTKNRLPGILGVDLPRDQNGDVQITPDIQTVVQRAAIDAINKDPTLALTYTGAQEKREDPFGAATRVSIANMNDATKRAAIAQQGADNAATNATNMQRSIIAGNATVQAALERAKTQKERDAILDGPSPLVLDEATGLPMPVSQYQTAHPGKAAPPFLSYRQSKSILDSQETMTKVNLQRAETDANNARVNALNQTILQKASNPDPNDMESKQVKHLMELSRVSISLPDGPAKQAAIASVNQQTHDYLLSKGWTEENIQKTMAVGGGWGFANFLSNAWTTMNNLVNVNAQPNAQHPVDSHNTTVNTPTQQTPSTGNVLNPAQSEQYLNSTVPPTNTGQ